jgi:hypothetical protein
VSDVFTLVQSCRLNHYVYHESLLQNQLTTRANVVLNIRKQTTSLLQLRYSFQLAVYSFLYEICFCDLIKKTPVGKEGGRLPGCKGGDDQLVGQVLIATCFASGPENLLVRGRHIHDPVRGQNRRP